MKELEVLHKDIPYLFRLYERVNEIDVFKNGLVTYSMAEQRTGLLNCTCPGSTYHGKCWHKGTVRELKEQPTIDGLWAEWGEESAIIRRGREDGRNGKGFYGAN